ncbi:MAG TPA: M48 family metalloprotease [Beijerinckiaceae bacterium]
MGARRGLRAGVGALALILSACAGDQTAALLPPSPPPEAPRAGTLDRAADREHQKLVAAFGGEYRAPQARALLAEITTRLVPATERPDEPYQVTILNSPVVNAFALPNGRLYVTRGLLALANDTAEIAAVLAHEIAHVTLRHANARKELELQSVLVSRVVADVLNDPNAGATMRDLSRVRIASFSRAQELEADQIGVRTLFGAKYDPYGAARFLTALGRAGGAKSGVSPASGSDMLSTHPATTERIAIAVAAARRIGAPGLGENDRARYLAAIDGLAYGDNPTDGIVRGRRFLHPRLGVAFEAPEGLALENTARAVVGASREGDRRLLFDAIEAPEGQSLEALLRSTWSDTIETGSVETTTVNGNPAALATSRGKDWAFRLAAIRVGATTYRLIYATRTLSSESDRAFRAALDSVRTVSAEEASSLQPLRLQVMAAGEGDTVASLAQRMPVDRPQETFLLLNGLDKAGPLKAGERYKVVVE